MYGVSFIFTFIVVFVVIINGTTEKNCGVLVKSLCKDNVTSKWNTKNVGYSLKSWFDSMEPGKKSNCFLNKRLVMERRSRSIRYISNFDCLTNHSIGPVWKTAGTISRKQFNDGFLYGHESKEGTLTGSFISFSACILIRHYIKYL